MEHDLVVIGSGPAGEKGAAQAAYFGKRVVVVEKEPEPGGAAVHTGTLPSKTLRETALFLSGYRQREMYGVTVQVDRSLAVPKLLSRKDAVRGQEVGRIRWNLDRHKVELVRGTARVVDPHTVEVASADGATRRLTAHAILVATGSEPHQPSDVPFADPDIDDSDSILQIDRLPRTMLVMGAGVIGCEYASMFTAMGVQVTLVEPRKELLGFLDADMSEALLQAFRAHGMDVRLEDKAARVRREGDQIVTTLASGGDMATDKLLYAAGRQGATSGLGLEALGVEINPRKFVVADPTTFQTKVPSIFAAGDVIGFPALASVSMEQARVAVCNAFGFDYKRQLGQFVPYGIYTIPEVSTVGLSEEDARAKDIDVVSGRAEYKHNARGMICGDTDGLVKLTFDRKTRALIGAHVLGDRATELVHIGQMALTLGGTIDTLIDTVFNYPTLAETYKYAAYDALGRWKS